MEFSEGYVGLEILHHEQRLVKDNDNRQCESITTQFRSLQSPFPRICESVYLVCMFTRRGGFAYFGGFGVFIFAVAS